MSRNLAEELPISEKHLLPLVVDLDGTLIHSDLLVESFLILFLKTPWQALKALGLLYKNRPAFKAKIASQATITCASLPFNNEVLELLS
jgi:hypothetical protein